MNKSIALLIIGVISLAMFLIMINHFTTSTTPPPLVGVQNPLPQTPTTSALSPPSAPLSGIPQSSSGLLAPVSPKVSTASGSMAPTAPATSMSPGPGAAASGASPNTSGGSHAAQRSTSENLTASSPERSAAPETKLAPPAAAKNSPPVAAAKPAEKSPPVKEAQEAPAASGPKVISKIVVSPEGTGANVRINGTRTLEYKTMHLKSPDRVVVDLQGMWAVKAPGVPANKAVTNVRIGKQGDKTRIVIDLSRTATVKFIKVNGNTMEVRVR